MQMSNRREITEEFLDGVKPPLTGEVWIPDTKVRGFGVRVWASGTGGGAAFGIRVKDEAGRTIRRTFRLFSDPSGKFLKRVRSGSSFVDGKGEIRISSYLDDARDWARVEIKKIKGENFSEFVAVNTEDERNRMLSDAGERLRGHTLGTLVEFVLSNGKARGWSSDYQIRLRKAFDLFDRFAKVRMLTIDHLSDGRLVDLVIKSRIGDGNLRLLRAILHTVLWNVQDLGGPPIGQMLPDHLRGISTERSINDLFLEEISTKEFNVIFSTLEKMSPDWRSQICIELCLHMRAPVSRVMTARWSQIVEDRWYPYSPTERRSWYWKFVRINTEIIKILTKAKKCASEENIISDYWLPSRDNFEVPIRNIDRVWKSVVAEMGWPDVSLSKAGKAFQNSRPIDVWGAGLERATILRELETWR